MSVIVKLLSKFDDSGIKQAKSSFGGLKSALGAIGIGYGIKQIADGLMDAAKAASADQKSMALLNDQLKRNAGATPRQIEQNNKFIDTLSNQVGIVDDELRPAMGKLVRGTRDVGKAQQLLKLSLDASKASGKPLETVATALSKAFNGNTSALVRMFPELKKSKDMLGDLQKEVGGTAAMQADPFAKFNVAMDNLKEKLGSVILPYISQFIDEMMKPGGAIDQVGQFLDDVSNPKTEAGQTFLQIKDAVSQTIGGVKDFFALFGNGDAMKGFGNVASNLVKALPALVALKGIMVLANSAKAIQNLVTAMLLIRGKSGTDPNGIVGGGKGKGILGKLTTVPVIGTVAGILSMSGDTRLPTNGEIATRKEDQANMIARQNAAKGIPRLFTNKGFNKDFKNPAPVNNITVNVHSADPKAVVDAIKQYGKQNGGLNSLLKGTN